MLDAGEFVANHCMEVDCWMQVGMTLARRTRTRTCATFLVIGKFMHNMKKHRLCT